LFPVQQGLPATPQGLQVGFKNSFWSQTLVPLHEPPKQQGSPASPQWMHMYMFEPLLSRLQTVSACGHAPGLSALAELSVGQHR